LWVCPSFRGGRVAVYSGVQEVCTHVRQELFL
jgi:hypothetical protein